MTAGRHRRDARPNALYLGVDGGGTRTTAWVADARAYVLGQGAAGPANPVKVGVAAAESAILAASKQALKAMRGKKLEAVCVGLAGADRPEISGPLLKRLRKSLPAEFHLVTTDSAIALESASDGLPCVVLIAGTGSIACARDAEGNLLRAGGWGSTFGDDGSGFDLGRQAVRAALRAVDGAGAPTRLAKMLARTLEIRDAREIIGLGLSPADIAGLAPVVLRSARAGDAVASAILDDAGGELANLALTLIRRLGLSDGSVSVVCAGGLLRESALMRRIVARHLKTTAPQAQVSRLRREPVEGALALALSKGIPALRRRSHSRRGPPFRRPVIS